MLTKAARIWHVRGKAVRCLSKRRSLQPSAHLRHEGEPRAQSEQADAANVDAVNEDAAAARLNDALERHHQRALAAARAARDTHFLLACASARTFIAGRDVL